MPKIPESAKKAWAIMEAIIGLTFFYDFLISRLLPGYLDATTGKYATQIYDLIVILALLSVVGVSFYVGRNWNKMEKTRILERFKKPTRIVPPPANSAILKRLVLELETISDWTTVVYGTLKLETDTNVTVLAGAFDDKDSKLDQFHVNKRTTAGQITKLLIDASFSSMGLRPAFKLRKGVKGLAKLRVYDTISSREVANVENRLQKSDINEIEVPLDIPDWVSLPVTQSKSLEHEKLFIKGIKSELSNNEFVLLQNPLYEKALPMYAWNQRGQDETKAIFGHGADFRYLKESYDAISNRNLRLATSVRSFEQSELKDDNGEVLRLAHRANQDIDWNAYVEVSYVV